MFEFTEEDKLADVAAAKYLKKFKNLDSDDNAIRKDEVLGCAAQETSIVREVVVNTPFVHIDAVNCDKHPDNGISTSSLCTTGDDFAISLGNSGLDAAPQSNSINREQRPYDKLDNHESRSILTELETRVSSPEPPSPRTNLSNPISDSPSRVEPVHILQNADECISERTTSSPSNSAEDGVSLNGWASDHCSGGLEMNQRNMTVLLQPDYVSYRDNYCTESLLTFSDSYIKATGLGNHGTFDIEWGIDDIVHIECQWIQGVDTVLIKLHVVSKDAVETDCANVISGIEELKISVVHPNWARKQEQITSLNDKYLAIWDVVAEEDMDEDAIPGRCYFPSFDEPFEEIVYPKGDIDPVSISKRDVDLLQPEIFINDTIIDFYIKYLKNQIKSEERNRFHFFNSFFFRKMADLDKDPSSASDGRAAFLRVRKWTRKVELFKKDYIFIPVNFNLHWSLIVICHPGEVATFQDDDLDQLHRVPCILHMDSIKGSHSGLKNLVQSYLWEEWKERQMEMSEQNCSKFLNLRFVELELPQQENSFDCGLFLLHYLELFLAEAPVSFNPFKINKFSAFLNMDWFPPVEASLKRTLIQKLIFDLLMNRSREASSSASSDEDLPSRFPENNGKETCVEFLSERCNPVVSSHGNFLSSQAGEGIEITLLSTSSMSSSHCVNDSGLVLRDLFESGAATGSLLGQYQSYQGSSFYHLKGGMSSVEEDADTDEDLVLLPSEEAAFGQMGRLASQDCSILQSPRGFTSNIAWDPSISTQAKHEDVNSSPKTPVCGLDDDIGIIEHRPIGKDVDQEEEKDRRKSPSLENTEDVSGIPTNAVEGSQDLDKIHANDGDVTGSLANAVEGSLDLYKTHANDGDVTGSLANAVEGSLGLDKTHASDGDVTGSLVNAFEGSQDLDKIHAEGGDHVLFKDLAREMAKTSTIEGAIECSRDLDNTQAKDGHHLPDEDPDSSKMAETSTVEDCLANDKIVNNHENRDHLPDSEITHVSSPQRPDLVDSKLDEPNFKPENRNDDDDDAELHVQQSGKRSYVSELLEEQAVKRMRLAPTDEGDVAGESVIQSDELHL